ncbi:MHS family proline/betaine transporter-like MFS transporter [Actinokineospora cianjurensis]|uniref:Putative proline/betaine transporter n=2 Tax=Actinokineospora cianjurensis TaxID=585224 RepID=A0A421B8A6_9PSEU|nr:MFS transporter [Actinokineospora cianjurensis]RLK60538.1 MHS family proline/betaine transporter-like MFS transporter [Actinokineospora cianjurensis]
MSESGTKEKPGPPAVRRAVAASAMGNCIEWYDFGVFGFMPAVLGAVFFDAATPTENVLGTFAVLAVAFVARPFGGFVFGPLGDRIGRRRVLAATIVLMSGSTFAIGLFPSYQTAGVLTPILVVLARLVQGFSAGGEYGGAATFIAEYAPDRRRGFLGSWLEFGSLGGYLLGAGVVTTCTIALGDAAMADWGWRIPFLVAGPLGLVGLYLRTRLEDTPLFAEITAKHQVEASPLKAVLRTQWRPILHLIGYIVLLNIADYVVLTYMESYLTTTLGLSGRTPLLVIMAVIVGMMALVGPVGALTDRLGRKPFLYAACAGFLVLPIPAFTLMDAGSTTALVAGLALIALPLTFLLATIPSVLPAMFPTRVRYGAFAIGYNLSTALFAGTAPYIVTKLVDATGDQLVPAYYLMGAALIAAVPIYLLPETAGKPLRALDEDPAPVRTR